MTEFGYSLYCEGFSPTDLVKQAVMAEAAGFDFLVISDHYHPWLTSQSHAGFAWSILGAVAQATKHIKLATMVTCPIVRYHPVIVAQMAATIGVLSDGRFTLGLGTGERLNEHVVGLGWPSASRRREMITEAIHIIKELWKGEYVDVKGYYFACEDARVFDLPKEPLQLFLAAGGPESAKLAGTIADGLCVTDADQKLIEAFRSGDMTDRRDIWAQTTLSWADTKQKGAQNIYDHFRFSIGGWKVQAELPNPVNFDAATQTTKPDDFIGPTTGPDASGHIEAVQKFIDVGVTKLSIVYPGHDTAGFLSFWNKEVRPYIKQKE